MTFRIDPPPQICLVLERLNAAGFAAHIVGGCVRDAMLGKTPHDWDVTTSAHPEQTAEVFRDFHVIETGMQHGTVTAVVDGMPTEITTYRIDGSYADHRRPDSVTFTDRLSDDLARRDFTMNAMAWHPEAGLTDPFGGEKDLAAGVIACVGNPAERFEEDGLRILRALRFASVFSFRIAPETAEAAREKRGLLSYVSEERIFAELTKMLCGKNPEGVLTEFPEILFEVLPELAPMYGFDQRNIHHDYDVYVHTLKTVSAVPDTPVLRWAALLHDSGKPHTFTEDERGGHFYGHNRVSLAIAEQIMARLKADNRTSERVCRLVDLHDTVWGGKAQQIMRTVRKIGPEATEQLLLLHRADVSAQAAVFREERIAGADRMLETLAELRAADACMSLKKMKITGHDVMAAGVPAGKAVGLCLNALLERIIDGELPNEAGALMQAAGEFAEQMQS